jgi:hypothetical protein
MSGLYKLVNGVILGCLSLIFAVSLINLNSVPVKAADIYAYSECQQSSINISNLFVISKNLPIIPANCSIGADGQPRPLSPSLLGSVAIRAYSFMVSLGFTIITPSLIGMGLLYIYSGVDAAQATFVKKWAQNLAVGLILMIFAYVIPLTIIGIFKINPDVVNLSNFFTF